MSVLIRNVVLENKITDILTEENRIVRIAPGIEAPGARIIVKEETENTGLKLNIQKN